VVRVVREILEAWGLGRSGSKRLAVGRKRRAKGVLPQWLNFPWILGLQEMENIMYIIF
jgi:hypothetical protein